MWFLLQRLEARKKSLAARWGMETFYLQLRKALELRAPGLVWKLERLHSCLASGKLQDSLLPLFMDIVSVHAVVGTA